MLSCGLLGLDALHHGVGSLFGKTVKFTCALSCEPPVVQRWLVTPRPSLAFCGNLAGFALSRCPHSLIWTAFRWATPCSKLKLCKCTLHILCAVWLSQDLMILFPLASCRN